MYMVATIMPSGEIVLRNGNNKIVAVMPATKVTEGLVLSKQTQSSISFTCS